MIREPYFSLTGYPVTLIGNNNLIQQDVTRAKLYVLRNKSLDLQFYRNPYNTLIAWKSKEVAERHDWIELKPISDLVTIQKIDNFIHILKLEIDGEISYDHPLNKTRQDGSIWYCLDNRIIIEGNGLKEIY